MNYNLIITLSSSITKLENVEVVVSTGYQDIPKERATGSFVKLDNELINRRVSTNILDRIYDVTSGLKKSTNTLVITLSSSITKLEEVNVEVSTGYQKISKERFVGSVSQLDSAAFHRRAGMGIIERLDGTVTGVLFDKKEGTRYSFVFK